MTLSPRTRNVLSIATMFLPMIGYTIAEYLVDHWAFARTVDALLKPYAFNASLIIGLLVGLAQLAWEYAKRRSLSLYALQQMGMLLAFTLVPLRFGHFVGGWDVFGLVGLGVALVYLVDATLGAELFVAFPRHFNPQVAERMNEPRVRRVLVHMEFGFVVTWILNSGFVLLGNRLLPKAMYLLCQPFYSKVLWGGFMAGCYAYPRWVQRRAPAAEAA